MRKRILLIDDYAPFANSLGVALSSDHEVEVTRSGAEAMACLQGPRFDAVLCDVVMPGLSGIDLYREVTRFFPQLARRFVFLTAGALSDETRAFLCEAGAPMLRKPFELQALLETLALLWTRSAHREAC